MLLERSWSIKQHQEVGNYVHKVFLPQNVINTSNKFKNIIEPKSPNQELPLKWALQTNTSNLKPIKYQKI